MALLLKHLKEFVYKITCFCNAISISDTLEKRLTSIKLKRKVKEVILISDVGRAYSEKGSSYHIDKRRTGWIGCY